jgi:16S rRNA (adenine1518-N6/adenine1519-N6)-dimethyltransferase
VKIYPKKSLGQNFLQDKNIIHKIIAAIHPQEDDNLVEIGPGLGALTAELINKIKNFTAIEFDQNLIKELKQRFPKLNIYQADALKFDFCTLRQNSNNLRIVGNLPYNISTPLLFHLFKQLSCIQDMYFMLQKEVVDRLAAQPGNKTYGRLSVMAQYWCKVEPLFVIPPQVFFPIPKVDSSFVCLIPHKERTIAATDVNMLEQVVKQSFSMRRKTIQNCLKGMITLEQLASLNIDGKSRAEQLSVEDFVRLSNLLK